MTSDVLPPARSWRDRRTLKVLGMGTDEALDRLVTRTGDGDLELVVTAVLIQRRVGGNLAEVLGNIAFMIRDRARVRGEIRTLTVNQFFF